MPGNIDAYKSALAYGARTNLFRMSLTPPTFVKNSFQELFDSNDVGGGKSMTTLSLFVHNVTFPKPRGVQKGTIDYAQEVMNYALENNDYEPTITLKFRNKTDFKLRTMFEYWMNQIIKPNLGVNASFDGTALPPTEYKTDDFTIDILNHMREPIRTAKIYGAFPLSLDSVALDVAANGEIFETSLILSIDYYDIVSSAGSATMKNLIDGTVQ